MATINPLMRKIYFVDLEMCGGDQLPGEFDLEDFCEKLQGKVPEVEIVPVIDEADGAVNHDPALVSDAVFWEAMGEYLHR